MLPVNSGGHSAYQNFVIENLRKYYPDPSSFVAQQTKVPISRTKTSN